jgi:hypothetical protein
VNTDQVGVAVPLPRLALCPECQSEVKIRADRRLPKHERQYGLDDSICCDRDGYVITRCPGSERVAGEPLEPTFARWLWMQSKRRDDDINVLTRFAAFQFRGCTRSPRLTARDMEWTTAEELHGRIHLIQLARAGTVDMNPPMGRRHDWMCDYLQQAAETYQRLRAAGDERPSGKG